MRVRLDSSLADDAGWSTAAAAGDLVLRCDEGRPVLTGGGRVVKHFADPLAGLDWLDRERRGDAGRRWVGLLGYKLGRHFEPTAAARPPRPTSTPLYAFARVPVEPGTAQIDPCRGGSRGSRPTSNFTQTAYLAAVRRCIGYVAAGDVFQINLAQQLALHYRGTADALYAALPPAAYGGLFDLGDVAVIGNSPELFLRVTSDNRVVTRPIKGTRPRRPGMREELLRSDKDAAELNMIVDLERNDLGRVCETGTVRVERPREIEEHPTVYHGAATVAGTLRPGVGLVELLAATFPSGSVTGAPKIRAMQIIDALEPDPRGPYCGAAGHLDADGSLQLNVAIRTATLKNGHLVVPVGGGIVADSDPASEYDETLVKARAILDAAANSMSDAADPHDPDAVRHPPVARMWR